MFLVKEETAMLKLKMILAYALFGIFFPGGAGGALALALVHLGVSAYSAFYAGYALWFTIASLTCTMLYISYKK